MFRAWKNARSGSLACKRTSSRTDKVAELWIETIKRIISFDLNRFWNTGFFLPGREGTRVSSVLSPLKGDETLRMREWGNESCRSSVTPPPPLPPATAAPAGPAAETFAFQGHRQICPLKLLLLVLVWSTGLRYCSSPLSSAALPWKARSSSIAAWRSFALRNYNSYINFIVRCYARSKGGGSCIIKDTDLFDIFKAFFKPFVVDICPPPFWNAFAFQIFGELHVRTLIKQ